MSALPPDGNFDLPPVLTLEAFIDESRSYFEPPPYISKFGAVPWADMDLPGPEHEWLIKNVISRWERSMMVGASGSGKSFLVIDLAMSIARGEPWLGNRTLRGGVVFQAGEGGKGIKKRIRAYRIEHGLQPSDNVPFVLLPKTIDLFSGDTAANLLIDEIKHWSSSFDCPLELVVIDTLSTATPGADENSSKDIGPVLVRCERIASETSAAVLLVHHMNAGGNKPRGHTSILANLDSVLKVEKLEEMDVDRRAVREIEITKQKDGEGGRKWRFVLPAVEIGRDADGDPVTSCVVRVPNADGEPGETSKPTDAGIRLTPQCEVFLRAIYRALHDHGEAAPAILGLPSGTKVVHWRSLAGKFAEMAFDGADEEDPKKRANALSQAMKRHGEKLMQLNVIMRQKPYIWLTGRRVRGFSRRADSASEKSRANEAPPPDPGPSDQEEVYF